jgi:hypothetical protein
VKPVCLTVADVVDDVDDARQQAKDGERHRRIRDGSGVQ